MLTVKEIVRSVRARRFFLPDKEFEALKFTGLSTDSRAIKKGELFLALKGPKFDGHDFVKAALAKGLGAVVSRPVKGLPEGRALIVVEDTLAALHDIARAVRMKRPEMPVCGVTGSNGKTTTKEFAALVLGMKFKNVLKSQGNLNNHIGLPLSLCRLSGRHGAAVLEMGASLPGEIKALCEIASPGYGVITNVSESHLEGFGTMEALIKTKLELGDAARFIIYNSDDTRLSRAVKKNFGKKIKDKTLISFGLSGGADVCAEEIFCSGSAGSRFRLRAGGQAVPVRLPAPGLFNVKNALAAAALGTAFGISPAEIASAFSKFTGVAMRYEIMEINGATIINDSYNANPASMEAGLMELQRLKRGRTVAVLGDMLELGASSEKLHRALGARAAALGVELFIAAGPLMLFAYEEFLKSGKLALYCRDSVEAGAALKSSLRKGDTVLVKGSRGMRMERAQEALEVLRAQEARKEVSPGRVI